LAGPLQRLTGSDSDDEGRISRTGQGRRRALLRKWGERWSKAGLTALIDFASDPEIRRQFITQLPGFLKTLIQRIGAALEVHASEPNTHSPVSGASCARQFPPGEVADFEARIPKDVASYLARVA
jgi:hypothetical protein